MHTQIERRILRRCAGDFAEPRAGNHDRSAGHTMRSRELQKCDVAAVAHTDIVDMEDEHSRIYVTGKRLRDRCHSLVPGA